MIQAERTNSMHTGPMATSAQQQEIQFARVFTCWDGARLPIKLLVRRERSSEVWEEALRSCSVSAVDC